MAGLAIRAITPADIDAVCALWERCGLVRPWNDPAQDIAFCLASGHGTVLVGVEDDRAVASVMTGHDGHRGWVYYLAVEPAFQGRGHGRAMMAAAEAWLGERAVPKVELMVRAENETVR